MKPRLSRRAFILAGGGIAAAFAAGVAGCGLIPPIPKSPEPKTADAVGWIQLDDNGRWLLWSPCIEMGQGILTALRLVAARELGVPPEQIDVRQPSTDEISRVKATVGSDSVRNFAPPLARACAALRDAVLARATAALGSSPELRFEEGRVANEAGESVTLASLANPALELHAEARPFSELRAFSAGPSDQAGSAGPVAQLEDIVAGRPLFTADLTLPGMVHAGVLRSPWIAELEPRLDSFAEAAVREIPGFVDIVTHDEIAGPVLVADSRAALDAMREAANPVWRSPPDVTDPMVMVDIDTALDAEDFTKSEGSVESGPWAVDMRLDVPLAAHCGMEPRSAVARFNDDGSLQIWCATQSTFFARDLLARDHDLALERIEVHPMRIGGGFGGKFFITADREAAFVAKAIGRPVMLHWTRAEEFQASHMRPPYSHRIRVRLDSGGRISDWWHAASSSHVFFSNAYIPSWMQNVTNFFGDTGTTRGFLPPYKFARRKNEYKVTRLPVHTSAWRGLGAGPNVLAIEMAMDAVARASGQDPLEFRLRHLDETADAETGEPARYAACLQQVAAMADAEPLEPARGGQLVARGLAGGVYKAMSYAAAVAEIVIEKDGNGRYSALRVRKIWCVQDCGVLIDPDGAQAQTEGNMVWSLGMVLTESLDAPDGAAAQTIFGEYEIPRMSDMPVLDIRFIESSEPPSGLGETAIVAGAGAIANAIVRATGVTPTRMPVTLETLNREG